MNLITIGKIINVRGLKGEVKIASSTDFPTLRYQKGKTVFLEKGQQMVPLTVKAYHHQGGFDFVQFDQYHTIEEVSPLVNLFLYAEKEAIRLAKHTYFFSDLVGCHVQTTTGEPVGVVSKVETFAQRILLRIPRPSKPDMLLPFLDVFVKTVDLNNHLITVELLEGML